MHSSRPLRISATAALVLAVAQSCARVTTPPQTVHPSGGTASSAPPAGLAVERVPQFVLFSFDDNGISGRNDSSTDGGLAFVTNLFDGRTNPAGSGNRRTYDGEAATFSFYVVTRYIAEPDVDAPEHVKRQWRASVDAGHEIGLHTHSHPHAAAFTADEWQREIDLCRSWLTRPFDGERAADGDVGIGMAAEELVGFRAPYLEHGPALFPALRRAGLAYDSSIEEGFSEGFDGTNLVWPYRIATSAEDPAAELWEIPAYVLIVPPDSECERYGVAPGLRDRLAEVQDYFDPQDGKITGFDWNLWVDFGMTRNEVVATVTYSLDQRLAGNRAPLSIGAHSDIYSSRYPSDGLNATAEERQMALAEILDYALSKAEVRVVSARQILEWVRAPVSF
jgi:peptidoglycan/xylan/chitin deacetylase (PgdA/CDA1 family)